MRSAPLLALLLFAPACTSRPSAPPPPARAVHFRATYSGSLDPAFPQGRDLTIAAGVEITDALRLAVEAALRRVLPQALACMEGIFGTYWTDITVDASGAVVAATVRPPTAGTLPAKCIETALRALQVGPLQGAPVEIAYPVRNLPNPQQLEDAAKLLKGL